MLDALTFGFDESTLAYDLQRAHSADIWFLRARFYFWATVCSVVSFFIGHGISLFGYNLYAGAWNGTVNLWNHLLG
ncbi:MAG: hypothetical protein GOVbin140_75 [Prokaryotic dsDNA virus sp.]|nr:MAG: hypothetical protein GOVbin140_75 [Prokaryotic dsDNA virus sp.]|tara:strand:- start:35093 stop:35320 length:228 start_codon:yes stop_codon:yes gene_type:complete